MRKHRHIGAYGIITNDNKILLIRKSRGAYTGKLDLPGGGLEHGETPLECVVREVKEETNLEVKEATILDAISCRIKWQDTNDIEDLHHIGILYKIEVIHPYYNKKDSDGLDSLGSDWYDISVLKKDDVSPFAQYAIEINNLKRKTK